MYSDDYVYICFVTTYAAASNSQITTQHNNYICWFGSQMCEPE